MIIDSIANAACYYSLHPSMEKALTYLAATDFSAKEQGKEYLDEGILISISRYKPVEPDRQEWEAHDHCIDIQYIADGDEKLGYAPRPLMKFVEKKTGLDKKCYKGEGVYLPMRKGDIAILFPQDVHKPKVNDGSAQQVVKVVCKLSLAGTKYA